MHITFRSRDLMLPRAHLHAFPPPIPCYTDTPLQVKHMHAHIPCTVDRYNARSLSRTVYICSTEGGWTHSPSLCATCIYIVCADTPTGINKLCRKSQPSIISLYIRPNTQCLPYAYYTSDRTWVTGSPTAVCTIFCTVMPTAILLHVQAYAYYMCICLSVYNYSYEIVCNTVCSALSSQVICTLKL